MFKYRVYYSRPVMESSESVHDDMMRAIVFAKLMMRVAGVTCVIRQEMVRQ